MQRRLEIARAMAAGPEILLLDEPAAGMNEQETGELSEFIRRLRGLGYTIILIEHDMRLVMDICDRIYVLDHGVLIASGKPGEIRGNPQVIEVYLGKEQ
jgi:branched-chain amino acid transport system ATP-binding protein